MNCILFDDAHKPNGELSRMYIKPFYCNEELYHSAEHFISAYKAIYFGDNKARRAILECYVPQRARLLAKKIDGFNDEAWKTQAEYATYLANYYKFYSGSLRAFLLKTGDATIIECGHDKFWCSGCSVEDLLSHKVSVDSLPGQNMYGQILMKIREQYREEEEAQ